MKIKTILAMEIQQNLKMQTRMSQKSTDMNILVSENTNWCRFWKLWQIKMHRIAGHGGISLSPASRRAGPQSKVPPQRRREGSRIQIKDSHWQHSPSQNPWRPSTRSNNWETAATILLCISKARGRLIWTGRTGVEVVQFMVSCLSLQWQKLSNI